MRQLGRLERMPDERGVKIACHQRSEGRHLQGRPRKFWPDDVEEDLPEIGVRGWRRRAQYRNYWRQVVQEAKSLTVVPLGI